MAGSSVSQGVFDQSKYVRFWLSAVSCGYRPRGTEGSKGSQRKSCSVGAKIFIAHRIPPAASSVGAASKVNWGAQVLSIYAAPTELADNFSRYSYKDFAPTEHASL